MNICFTTNRPRSIAFGPSASIVNPKTRAIKMQMPASARGSSCHRPPVSCWSFHAVAKIVCGFSPLDGILTSLNLRF